jgi:hypothetical protein
VDAGASVEAPHVRLTFCFTRGRRKGVRLDVRPWLAVVALLVVGGGACNESPTTPSQPFEGTWIGRITTTLGGVSPGTATATFTQDGTQVTGSLHTVYPEPPNNSGSFSNFFGNAAGTTLSGLVPNPPSCPYRLTATLNGTQLTGTFESEFFCPVAFTGTFDLKKEP